MRVVLFVCTRVIASVKFGVVLLLAMIRKGLARDLSSCNASSVSKTRHEERVNVAIALKAVQQGGDAFVEKGHRSHLNADYSIGGLNLRKS